MRALNAERLRGAVGRASDRRLERTLGSAGGLWVIFRAMRARYVPAAAGDFAGAIAFVLTDGRGGVLRRGLRVEATGATLMDGADAALTLELSRADFVRLAAGSVDPVYLLLSGRMELRGDFAVAARLGPMFGL